MDKKYAGTTIVLSKDQTEILYEAKSKMEEELLLKLSKSAVIQRLLKLYLMGQLQNHLLDKN
tara:strand:- start:137 stop:322 length:186 start_codon:yes stop_codon:yes gene_type:complete